MANKNAEWTIMVYLAGDNNLSAECVQALTEMKRVDQKDRINIIAQFNPKDDYLPTRRYKITQDSTPGNLIGDDQGGVTFQNESRHAQRCAKARIAALREGKKAATAAALTFLGNDSETINGRIAIAKNGLKESIEFGLFNNDAVIEESETDSGSPTTLYNFMSYCVTNFPAEHYMVVLSGHGGGTEQGYLMKAESSGGSLTLSELRQAFENLRPELGRGRMIDILGMDSCLMSMVEVCYELKGFVQILTGSESYSPASGWPYLEILERLVRETFQGGKDIQERIAKGVVDEYVNFYSDYWLGGVSVAQSALDVTKVEDMKKYIDELADALTEELENPQTKKAAIDALIMAHWEAQSYNGELFVDLADFCQCLRARYQVKKITDRCEKLEKFITRATSGDANPPRMDTFVLRSCFSGPVFQYSYGVSIYFPWAKVTPDYKELSFVKNTPGSGWAKFLETYTEKTRRLPRNIDQADKFAFFNSSLAPQAFRMVEGMGPGNPMHSMRNPPLIAKPDNCIRARESIIQGMEKVLAEMKTSQPAQQRKKKLAKR
ncbi:MAG: clostripain-related cysteine peptidase [Acidobacteria bacterium]|nr:clostripain-related cysteine peptidase [Acidobacteriota bacterium]